MEPRDEQLWKLAKKRADFKKHLFSYLIINPFLWAIWWVTIGRYSGFNVSTWPVYATLGWGVGLLFNYLDAYVTDSSSMIEKEYEKLNRKK